MPIQTNVNCYLNICGNKRQYFIFCQYYVSTSRADLLVVQFKSKLEKDVTKFVNEESNIFQVTLYACKSKYSFDENAAIFFNMADNYITQRSKIGTHHCEQQNKRCN